MGGAHNGHEKTPPLTDIRHHWTMIFRKKEILLPEEIETLRVPGIMT